MGYPGRKKRSKPGRDRHSDHMTAEAVQRILRFEIESLGYALPEAALPSLVEFIQLLEKWNTVYNLTSVRDKAQMVYRHILDSLVISPFLQGEAILDVGSGAGLPGIPLAIVNPDCQFTLLDSNQKKTRFIQQAVGELGLTNIEVITERIEDFQSKRPYDTVTARAYSAIENLIKGVDHLLHDQSVILAMKGTYPIAELENIPSAYHVENIEKLQVPGLDADRHLVIIKRKQS